ncbi:MAG: DUF4013 domain-containing protein [Chloroflexi bacterium]|nr:DUF4013 domain-containing protein [Chloroflexota bacterium]
MTYSDALTYWFQDDEVIKKIGLAVLIQFIPLIGLLALGGWGFEIAKNVKAGNPAPLPDWSDFGGKIGKGFMLVLALLLYQLPLLLVICVQVAFTFGLAAVAGGGGEDAAGAFGLVGPIVIGCLSCLAIVYAIVASLVYQAGYIRYIETEEFSAFTGFGDNFSMFRENLGDFGMLILYFIVTGFIVGLLSGTFILGLLALPVQNAVNGHLLGQLARKLGGASAVPAV